MGSVARILAIALVTAGFLAPLAASDVGPIQTCPGGFGARFMDRGACGDVTVEDPAGFIPSPIIPDTTPCTTPGFSGVNVSRDDTYLEVCVSHGSRMPTVGSPLAPRVSIPSCGPGTDPRVDVMGGWVFVCAVVLQHVGIVDTPEIDLEPCPGGFDPAIRSGESEIEVCIVLNP